MAELTPEERQRLINIQSEIQAQAARAGAPNPEGRPRDNEAEASAQRRAAFEAARAAEQARLAELQSEYLTLKSKAPPEFQSEIESGGRRSTKSARTVAISEYGGNIITGEMSANPEERKKQENLSAISEYYDYATEKQIYDFYDSKITEKELAAKDAERASKLTGTTISPKQTMNFSTRPAPKQSTGIDYEGTLAARVAGYNVGSGISYGLAETFQKEEDRRFGERNRFIGLVEGATPEAKVERTIPQVVTPQRQRVKAQQGSTDALFANPDYAKRGSDRYMGVKYSGITLDSALSTASANYRSGSFEMPGSNAALLFGIEPEKPKELSDAEAAKMSPYEIAAYNKRVDTWNQYVEYAQKKSKVETEASRIVGLANWRGQKQELKKSISEMKKAGFKYVSIGTEKGSKTVPVDRAFYEIIKTKDIKGIMAVPELPQGYAVAGSPQEMVFVKEQDLVKTRPTSENPKPGDIAGESLRNLENLKSKNPVVQFGKGVYKEAIAGVTIGTNLIGEYVTTPMYEAITGKKNIISTQSYIPSKLTAVSEFTGGLVEGGIKVIEKRNLKYFPGAAAEALENASQIAKEQGPFETVGGIVGSVLPFGASEARAALKILPLRPSQLVIPIIRGGGSAASVESAIIAREIKLGYGSQMGRAAIGYSEGGRPFVGLPKAESLPLEKIAYTTERGGYRISEGPSGVYMTRPETLKRMVEIGKLRPQEAAQIARQKEGLKITEKYEDIALRKTLTPTGAEQPQASLLPGKETSTLERLVVEGQKRFRETLPAVKGSIINQYYSLTARQRRDLDVDLGMTKKNLARQEALAEKESKRISEGLTKLGGRKFTAKGGAVESPTGKVIEFVTEKESLNYQRGFKTDPDLVLGYRAPHKVVQPGGKGTYKMLTYRFQGVRKVSSILELGGDAPKPKGVSLGASKGREKDFFDVVEYYETKASQASPEDAARLRQIAQETKDYAKSIGQWSEQKPLDLGKTEFADVEPENILKSVGTASKKGSELGGAATAKQTLAPKDQDYETGIYRRTRQRSVSMKSISSRSTGTRLESPGSRSTGSKIERSVASISSAGGRRGSPGIGAASPGRSAGTGKYRGITYGTVSPALGYKGGRIAPGRSPGTKSPSTTKSPTAKLLTGKVAPAKPAAITRQPARPATTLSFKVSTSKKERREKEESTLADFLGSSHVGEVEGFRTKQDITYGRSLTAKLVSRDVTRTGRKAGSFVRGSNRSLLDKKKGGRDKRKWAL